MDSTKVDVICFATGFVYSLDSLFDALQSKLAELMSSSFPRYNFYFPFCLPTDAPWNSHPVTLPRTFQTGEGDDALPPSDKIDEASYNGGAGQVDQLDESCQLFYLPDPTIIFVGLGELSFRSLSRVETEPDIVLVFPIHLTAYMVVPFRLGETQARLATRAWTKLRRIPAGLPPLAQSTTLEGNRHCVGYPAEVSHVSFSLFRDAVSDSLRPPGHQRRQLAEGNR